VALSLGLGIGANTAIFSLMHQAILAALPVAHPEQLVLPTSPANLKNGRVSTNDAGHVDHVFSYPAFRALELHPEGLTAIAAFRKLSANLAFRNQTVHGDVMVVSGRYFSLLGVQPEIGRILTPADDVPGAGNPVAVLSYNYWAGPLGAQANALNQPIRVNGHVFTIVGVAAADSTESPSAISPPSSSLSLPSRCSLPDGTEPITSTITGSTSSRAASRNTRSSSRKTRSTESIVA
jgi:putative ABC transport system permease protein